MKTFLEYVNEAYADDKELRHEESNEDSNMPPARDSISPIHSNVKKGKSSNPIRNYLDIIDEEPLPAGVNQASMNVGDNTNFTADKTTNTVSGTMNVDPSTTVSATKDLNVGGASTVSATTKLAPNLTTTATQSTPAYNKGQIGGTSSVSQTLTTPTGQQQTATATKGIGFAGAGKNVRPGQNIVTNYKTQ